MRNSRHARPAKRPGPIIRQARSGPIAGAPLRVGGAKADPGPSTNKMRPGPSENKAAPDPAAVDATDMARALAEQHGIELGSVRGSGRGGRITADDVKRVLEADGETAREADG